MFCEFMKSLWPFKRGGIVKEELEVDSSEWKLQHKYIVWYVPDEIKEYDECLASDYYCMEEEIGGNYSKYYFENFNSDPAPRLQPDKKHWIKLDEYYDDASQPNYY